ncbi:MAG: NAD-dependent epimerase/dehydratase family protein [Candidatus Nitrosotenuis sp.]
MDRILITGSSGFIGTQVVEKLAQYQTITDSNGKRTDLRVREQVVRIDPADVVIHLGGKTPQEELKWSEYFDNNTSGTLNVLEYCMQKKVKKMIYVSSYVYGKPEHCPIDEDHPINPHNAYAESKYLGERLCQFYCSQSDLSVIILRPFNIFGESMRGGFLIPNLVDASKTNNRITIINKKSKRDFLHIDDFVELILKVKDYNAKFEIFNVGSGESHSFEEIIEKIEKFSSKKLNVDYQEDNKSFIDDIRSDISKIKNKIGWQPRIKFDDGLQRVLKSRS